MNQYYYFLYKELTNFIKTVISKVSSLIFQFPFLLKTVEGLRTVLYITREQVFMQRSTEKGVYMYFTEIDTFITCLIVLYMWYVLSKWHIHPYFYSITLFLFFPFLFLFPMLFPIIFLIDVIFTIQPKTIQPKTSTCNTLGYKNGYKNGYTDGYEEGSNNNDHWYNDGYMDGYKNGYDVKLKEEKDDTNTEIDILRNMIERQREIQTEQNNKTFEILHNDNRAANKIASLKLFYRAERILCLDSEDEDIGSQ